ncbi:hypothetical protein E0L20_04285 [Enterobacter wuhouensis]|uniref:Uncharacterized protein n=1 Tax=Enterobacter wuhouensis TaxID=2529381 RepID=A0A4R0GC41_9ENTR|nr:hypothetical protein E0L20_04285 [Enterobacter wuhouensis]
MSPAIAQMKKRLLSIFYAGYVYGISRNGLRGGEKFFTGRLKAAEKMVLRSRSGSDCAKVRQA